MLSFMETPQGVTIVGPQGQALRLHRGHLAFTAGKELLQQALPAEQVWQKLQELLANPLQALANWCTRFGLRLSGEGEILRLQDVELNRGRWLPLLQRAQAAAGSPLPVLHLAEKLGAQAEQAEVAQLCLHWRETPMGPQLGIVKQVGLPEDVRVGDLVLPGASGGCACLVSYDQFWLESADSPISNGIVLSQGMVIARQGDHTVKAEAILAEPVIMGFNRTYRCEEGTSDGWLEDLSFDSLAEARLNAKEIQESGGEARIINRITGDVVALH